MLPSPLGDGVGPSNHDRFRGYLSVHLRSGLQFPCLRFAAAVTERHARLGTRLLARPCRGCHFRRLCLTSFQGATPTDPDVRVLPHPAPRQTASLRAVAYPLVQEARRWPPPSLRLVWPVRLSVVVTWRRDPTSVCWPSFPPTVPPAGAPSLHGVSWAQFPRFGGTMEMARRKGTLWQREKGPLCRVVVATWPDGAERREATSRRVPINAFSSVERGPSGSVGRP